MNARAILSAGLSLLFVACTTVGPDYRLPDQAIINAEGARGKFVGSSLAAVSQAPVADNWWQLYDDPQLNTLVEQAMGANTDLRVAAANLARSEAAALDASGAQDPKLSLSAAVARAEEAGEAYIIPAKLPVENLADGGARISYQIDLVGGLKRAAEAATADAQASRAALDLARISIVADVVLAYADVCSAGQELDVAAHSLDLQQRNLAAVTRLVNSGRSVATDLPRARALVAQSSAVLPTQAARRRVALYRLAVLTGHPPGEYSRQLETCNRLPQLKQPIPVGDGTTLLRRRPDVRQAERALASATARVGVATAALYPTITLGASAGVTGILEHTGDAATRRWSLGPLISWTLPGAQEKARLHQADANTRAALAHFDAVVLNALQEVDVNLALLARDLDRNAALRQARDEAALAARQVQSLYQAGRLPYLDHLDAQRSQAAADAALAACDGQVAADQIRLFLALGGGWAPEH